MHWKEFRDRKYAGAWTFADEPMTLIVDHVEEHVVEKPNKKDERVPLMFLRYLDGTPFEWPVILNDGNALEIEKMYGASDTRLWHGKPVTFTVGPSRDLEGKPCTGIKVDPRKPEPPKTAADEAAELAQMERDIALRKARVAAAASPPADAPRELPPAALANTVPELEVKEAQRAAS